MPLESASYISELVATNPTASDPKSQGDNHLRLVKSVLQTQFPNFGTNAITATAAELNYSVGVTSAIQAQLNAITTNYAPLLSPSFTGSPTAPTPSAGDSSTKLATTAFVATSYAPLVSPAFTGSPTAPTASAGDSSTKLATTAFVSATAFASALPTQAGNAGKFVTTNGTTASWATVDPKVLQRTITGADTLIASDLGKLINLNGTFTLSATAAATLGDGWWCYLRNTGTGVVTLDPNGSETVDGATSGVVRGTVLLVCDGTSFTATKLGPYTTTEVLTSGTSWTAPLGVRTVRARGQGGSGGKGQGSTAAGGGGGGGFDVVVPIAPATAYAYAIGAAGVDSTTGSGNPGGDTTLTVDGNTYTAKGGGGGATSAAPIGNGSSATGPGILKMLGGTGFNIAGIAPIYGSGALGYHATSTNGNQSTTPGVLVLEY